MKYFLILTAAVFVLVLAFASPSSVSAENPFGSVKKAEKMAEKEAKETQKAEKEAMKAEKEAAKQAKNKPRKLKKRLTRL